MKVCDTSLVRGVKDVGGGGRVNISPGSLLFYRKVIPVSPRLFDCAAHNDKLNSHGYTRTRILIDNSASYRCCMYSSGHGHGGQSVEEDDRGSGG